MSEAEIVGRSRIPVGTLAARIGVGLSLALVLGAGVWGWRLLEREAVGVPIIRAAEGPMRIAPEVPGGDLADHLGLSVSRIAAGLDVMPLAPEVHLAPRPLDLLAADMPAILGPAVPAINATDLAVAEALGLDVATLVPVSAPAISRPAGRAASRAAAAAGGGEVVQLGAFPEEDLAIVAWRSLVARFPDLLEGAERRIERVDRDDRTFWRLRAGGFADLADARRACVALMAGDAECIPVVRH